MPEKEQALFNQHFDHLLSENTKELEDNLLGKLNQLTNNQIQPTNRKDAWKLFSLHSTEKIISGRLILRGIRLKNQNESTLKLFMHQITSALENRVLVEQNNRLNNVP